MIFLRPKDEMYLQAFLDNNDFVVQRFAHRPYDKWRAGIPKLDIYENGFSLEQAINNLVKKMREKLTLFEIWREGYRATGEEDGAAFIAKVVADSFEEACFKLAEEDSDFKKLFDPERLTWWGCHLYSNERQARARYG